MNNIEWRENVRIPGSVLQGDTFTFPRDNRILFFSRLPQAPSAIFASLLDADQSVIISGALFQDMLTIEGSPGTHKPVFISASYQSGIFVEASVFTIFAGTPLSVGMRIHTTGETIPALIHVEKHVELPLDTLSFLHVSTRGDASTILADAIPILTVEPRGVAWDVSMPGNPVKRINFHAAGEDTRILTHELAKPAPLPDRSDDDLLAIKQSLEFIQRVLYTDPGS